MAFTIDNLGCNSGHLSPAEIKALGYSFIETSLSKQYSHDQMVKKILGDLDEAKELEMKYAIHLPLFLSEDWLARFDCYDAFYLDPDPEMRELSFVMLKDNLDRLTKTYQPMYFVIHFPGIYSLETTYNEPFEALLKNTLDRLNVLASQYGCMIALEYFATNARFAHYQEWVSALQGFGHLAPLLDTGHLYFNCFKNQFEYDEVLAGLAPHCIGFHLWNVHGEGYYDLSESYKAYHHIVPHLEQTREGGWAFNPEILVPYIAQFNKPILVEAGQRYNGIEYFKEGLIQMRDLLKKG